MNRAWTLLLLASGMVGISCSDDSTKPGDNQPPRIVNAVAQPDAIALGGSIRLSVLASDPDQDPLTFLWSAESGAFDNPTASVTNWTAPDSGASYVISISVSDGSLNTTGNIEVLVGSASIAVESDPEGAFIFLDGSLTQFKTPHTFDPIPPGFHQVNVNHPNFVFETESAPVDLIHGDVDTVRFAVAPVNFFNLDLGRSDFEEMGGVAYLETGTGILYAARTASGTAIFSSSFNPPSGTTNGIELVSDVLLTEPIAVSRERLFYVSSSESLMVARFRDSDANGLVDSLLWVHGLRDQSYGPAISSTNILAFTLTASSDPPGFQILRDLFDGDFLMDDARLASASTGRLPSWEPTRSSLVYERGGTLFTTIVLDGNLPSPDTLAISGYNTAPQWGPRGPRHVAWLRGADAGSLEDLVLAVPGDPETVTIPIGMTEARFLSWSPTQRALAITENIGAGRIRLMTNLPIR